MRRAVTGLGLAVGLVIGLGGTAWAGEYTGNGYDKGVNQNASECAYSGQDLPDGTGPGFENNPFPFLDDDAVTTRGKANNDKQRLAQNYGAFVSKGMKGEVPSPSQACNKNKASAGAPG